MMGRHRWPADQDWHDMAAEDKFGQLHEPRNSPRHHGGYNVKEFRRATIT